MSTEKSTIDRFPAVPPQHATAHGRRPGTAAKSPTTFAAPQVTRALFALLDCRAPAIGGWLAERLWFRLPPRPAAAVRADRTPPGGEPFEVPWAHGVIRGRVYGEWGNPTAYLVHGWGGWWQQLSAHVEPLVESGLCVVAFDAPSHGDSGPGAFGARSTTFVEMAQGLTAVVAEFGRPTAVIAHSAGGLATLHALGRGVAPDSVVLIAPSRSVDGLLRLFSGALGFGQRTRHEMARRAERRVGLTIAELDMITMAARHPVLPHLLVVHDRDDVEADLSGAVAIADAWHDARLMLTDGLGHRRVMWHPAVVERVSGFVAQAADRVRRSSR